MFEAFLNRLKDGLESITAIFGGFTSVFTAFMRLAANSNEAMQEEDESSVGKRR